MYDSSKSVSHRAWPGVCLRHCLPLITALYTISQLLVVLLVSVHLHTHTWLFHYTRTCMRKLMFACGYIVGATLVIFSAPLFAGINSRCLLLAFSVS